MAISIQERVERTLERHGYEVADASSDGEGYYIDDPGFLGNDEGSSTVTLRYAALGTPIQEQRLWVDIRYTLERAGFRVQQGVDEDGPFLHEQRGPCTGSCSCWSRRPRG